MTYILLDAGNSYLKLAKIEQDAEKITEIERFSYDHLKHELTHYLQDQFVSAAVLSNVNNLNISHTIIDVLHKLWQIEPHQLVVEQGKYGLFTRYDNPRLLGSDRWAALIAAKNEFDCNVCIIDCGSAVTIDVLTDRGIHLGGLITPGISMSRNALGISASQLPLVVSEKDPDSSFLAINTRDAILGGTLYQISAYIERIVTEIKAEFNDNVECIITGGDSIMFQSLSMHHFHHREALVLEGLRIVAQKLSD